MNRFATYLKAALEIASPMMEDTRIRVNDIPKDSWWCAQATDAFRCLESQLDGLDDAKQDAMLLNRLDVIIVLADALSEHFALIDIACIGHMMKTAYNLLGLELSRQARKHKGKRGSKLAA